MTRVETVVESDSEELGSLPTLSEEDEIAQFERDMDSLSLQLNQLLSTPTMGGRSQTLRTSAPDQFTPTPKRRNRSERTPLPVETPMEKAEPSPSQWSSILDSMKQLLQEQEDRIRVLEQEQCEYQREIRELKSENTSLRQHRETTGRRPARSEYYPRRETACRFFNNVNSSSEDVGLDAFSPGTKLVAQLSKHVQLDVGQHASLSLLLDRELFNQ